MFRLGARSGNETAVSLSSAVKGGLFSLPPPFTLPVLWVCRAVISGVLAGFDLISCRQGFVLFTLMIKRAGRVCHPGLFPASNVYVEGMKNE